MKTLTHSIVLALILFSFASFKKIENPGRPTIDLSGTWQFAIDESNSGIRDKWFSKIFSDSIILPGTMDLGRKGKINRDTTTMHLNRVYIYEGVAWYRKTFTIPKDWKNKHVRLILERTKPSMVWIDSQPVGKSFLLESPQEFDFENSLTPGKHTITVRVNNDLKLTPYGNVHIYSDDTQTNWNGIIGSIELEATDKTFIRDAQIYPDVDRKSIKVRTGIDNPSKGKMNITVRLIKNVAGVDRELSKKTFQVDSAPLLETDYQMPADIQLWDEYSPAMYIAEISIISGSSRDAKRISFGMRKFEAKKTQFAINHRSIFLRGKHDACVFPLTGHPPMDVQQWISLFNIAKSYGVNHYRFHSWCPPAAAFEAADEVGMYLQPELPLWGGLDTDTLADKLMAEGRQLLKAYGNHPSFVMFSAGNELWSGHERAKRIITELRQADPRHLYAQGSNNSIGYAGFMEGTDFHIAARTPYRKDTILTHVRLTHAFVDSHDGGILNTVVPSTLYDFSYPVSAIPAPLVSHEVGQYQSFPDYRQINKYTGILRAWNLDVFKKRFQQAGLSDQNIAFTKASGALASICYRAEIETALRTPSLGGFQLLDLQDFPGQGTALVGILDAFMESKDIISRQSWRQFCNDIVPLLKFEKYCWTDGERFNAQVLLANYSAKSISVPLPWELLDHEGKVLQRGQLNSAAAAGEVKDLGSIQFQLSTPNGSASQVTLMLGNAALGYENRYDLWIYPQSHNLEKKDINVEPHLTDIVLQKLMQGEKVLLFPAKEDIAQNSVEGLFPPDFWNYKMFKEISESSKKPISPGTLGLLIDTHHPSLSAFPTEFHTNWQWWQLIKHSASLKLDATAKDYRPIVQVIDNIERNSKMGFLFEFAVGKGKLLVCTSRLPEILEHPEAKQLYQSLLRYIQSDNFRPQYPADRQLLTNLGLLH